MRNTIKKFEENLFEKVCSSSTLRPLETMPLNTSGSKLQKTKTNASSSLSVRYLISTHSM
jgi:hypothetical protein